MRILVYSPVFAPSVGGLEFMADVLASEFVELKQEVVVVTTTADPAGTRFPYRVARSPSARGLVGLFRWSDVVLQMNMSLRGLWPFALVRRPLVVGHNGFYRRDLGRLGIRDRLKYWVARFVTNVACSEAVKADLPAGTVVIGNAYNDAVFTRGSGRPERDVVFVGRLVSEKGADLLLESLAELHESGLRPTLTIVGFGPEENRLRVLCDERRLRDTVNFHGRAGGAELAQLLQRHRIMVVPSRNEGFGVVALEGIASGCVVVGSDAGGLPEAIGACGKLFPNGNSAELARILAALLRDESMCEEFRKGRDRHLARFSRRNVALGYLAVLEGAVRKMAGA